MTKDEKADPNTHALNETLKESFCSLRCNPQFQKLNTDRLYRHPQSAPEEIQFV